MSPAREFIVVEVPFYIPALPMWWCDAWCGAQAGMVQPSVAEDGPPACAALRADMCTLESKLEACEHSTSALQACYSQLAADLCRLQTDEAFCTLETTLDELRQATSDNGAKLAALEHRATDLREALLEPTEMQRAKDVSKVAVEALGQFAKTEEVKRLWAAITHSSLRADGLATRFDELTCNLQRERGAPCLDAAATGSAPRGAPASATAAPVPSPTQRCAECSRWRPTAEEFSESQLRRGQSAICRWCTGYW